jgi:hypothetical protein
VAPDRVGGELPEDDAPPNHRHRRAGRGAGGARVRPGRGTSLLHVGQGRRLAIIVLYLTGELPPLYM